MDTNKVAPTAFLSHATADREVANRLARDLIQHGVDVWYADWEIRPGDSLRRKIDAGIDSATYFLVLLTPASLLSEWVQTELDAGMVARIAGKCRLIPILSGIQHEQVPVTLRGLLYVNLAPYEDGLARLIDACHEVSIKPPLGKPPAWASERPLPDTGLSPQAQRLVVHLNNRSEHGLSDDLVERDTLLTELKISPEQLGMAASELEGMGLVKLTDAYGSGPAGFIFLSPTPKLFIDTDPLLREWNPVEDALVLAAAMVNASDDCLSLAELDQALGWGPRRLNPAADYLVLKGIVRPLDAMGSAPYSYLEALIDYHTRRFAQGAK